MLKKIRIFESNQKLYGKKKETYFVWPWLGYFDIYIRHTRISSVHAPSWTLSPPPCLKLSSPLHPSTPSLTSFPSSDSFQAPSDHLFLPPFPIALAIILAILLPPLRLILFPHTPQSIKSPSVFTLYLFSYSFPPLLASFNAPPPPPPPASRRPQYPSLFTSLH